MRHAAKKVVTSIFVNAAWRSLHNDDNSEHDANCTKKSATKATGVTFEHGAAAKGVVDEILLKCLIVIYNFERFMKEIKKSK